MEKEIFVFLTQSVKDMYSQYSTEDMKFKIQEYIDKNGIRNYIGNDQIKEFTEDEDLQHLLWENDVEVESRGNSEYLIRNSEIERIIRLNDKAHKSMILNSPAAEFGSNEFRYRLEKMRNGGNLGNILVFTIGDTHISQYDLYEYMVLTPEDSDLMFTVFKDKFYL